jgi:hypothetical protein
MNHVNFHKATDVLLCQEFCTNWCSSRAGYQHILIWARSKRNTEMEKIVHSVTSSALLETRMVVVILGRTDDPHDDDGYVVYGNKLATDRLAMCVDDALTEESLGTYRAKRDRTNLVTACGDDSVLRAEKDRRDLDTAAGCQDPMLQPPLVRFSKEARVKQCLQLIQALCTRTSVRMQDLCIVTLVRQAIMAGSSCHTWQGMLPTVLVCPQLKARYTNLQLRLTMGCLSGEPYCDANVGRLVVRSAARHQVCRVIQEVKLSFAANKRCHVAIPRHLPADEVDSKLNSSLHSPMLIDLIDCDETTDTMGMPKECTATRRRDADDIVLSAYKNHHVHHVSNCFSFGSGSQEAKLHQAVTPKQDLEKHCTPKTQRKRARTKMSCDVGVRAVMIDLCADSDTDEHAHYSSSGAHTDANDHDHYHAHALAQVIFIHSNKEPLPDSADDRPTRLVDGPCASPTQVSCMKPCVSGFRPTARRKISLTDTLRENITYEGHSECLQNCSNDL